MCCKFAICSLFVCPAIGRKLVKLNFKCHFYFKNRELFAIIQKNLINSTCIGEPLQMRILLRPFYNLLEKENLSTNTLLTYKATVRQFFRMHSTMTSRSVSMFKNFLIEHYKVKTANLKLLAINKYISLMNLPIKKLKLVRYQQKPFLENVISDADYRFFKSKLKTENNKMWYYVVRFLAATGARISELVQIKVEHVYTGYIDIYGKAGKVRRIYIPKLLQQETLEYLAENEIVSGYLFTNRYHKKFSTRGIAGELKKFAIKYQMNPQVVYPHSFRHRFAKNFLEKYNDVALLADLMGHDSIETTRIYLRKTSTEQKALIDNIVIW